MTSVPMIVALPHRSELEHPAGPLMEKLGMALAAVAPERIQDLNKVTAGSTLNVTNDLHFVCRYSPSSRTIEVSRGVVEALWCASYAYLSLYETLNAVGHPTESVVVDLTKDDGVKKAMKLLKWSIAGVLGDKSPWPADCPVPERNSGDTTNAAATELALVAAAFMLHHELAHDRHGHVGLREGVESIEQEREADYAAAAWILGTGKLTTAEFHKRSLGIAIGLSLLVALGIHSGSHGGNTHPLDFDRLVHTLSRHVENPQDAAWAMSLAILKLHMDNMKIAAPRDDYESCREAVEDYANVLADRAAERSEQLTLQGLFAL